MLVAHLRSRRRLDAFADGELDPPLCARVCHHLATCARCRTDVLLTARLKDTLRRRRPAEGETCRRRWSAGT